MSLFDLFKKKCRVCGLTRDDPHHCDDVFHMTPEEMRKIFQAFKDEQANAELKEKGSQARTRDPFSTRTSRSRGLDS